jgi:tRNA A58 N-methylase Trm61
MDTEHVHLARKNIAKEGLSDRVQVHSGDFVAILDQLPGNYNLIFFDGFAVRDGRHTADHDANGIPGDAQRSR